MARRPKTSYWIFSRGPFSTVSVGAAGSTPLEKPLLPYSNGGTGHVYNFNRSQEAPYFAAPNLIIVGLGGLQQGQLVSPGPLYSQPGQTFQTIDPATLSGSS
jgi:hypothetical protein